MTMRLAAGDPRRLPQPPLRVPHRDQLRNRLPAPRDDEVLPGLDPAQDVTARIAQVTQVLLFTRHRHLVELAEDALGERGVRVLGLAQPPTRTRSRPDSRRRFAGCRESACHYPCAWRRVAGRARERRRDARPAARTQRRRDLSRLRDAFPPDAARCGGRGERAAPRSARGTTARCMGSKARRESRALARVRAPRRGTGARRRRRRTRRTCGRTGADPIRRLGGPDPRRRPVTARIPPWSGRRHPRSARAG